MKYVFYVAEHAFSQTVSKWFSSPAGYDATTALPYYLLPESTAITYGILRGCGGIIKAAEREHRPYFYVDHSYFWSMKGVPSAKDYGHYFRIIRDGRYFNDLGPEVPSDRFDKLGIKLAPWAKGGDRIVVVPLSKFVAFHMGVDANDWLVKTMETLKAHTDRPIVIKPKNSPSVFQGVSPFVDFIKGAHAVVVAESNVAVDAVVEGVPVFCSSQCPVASAGLTDITKIETPVYPDRAHLMHMLAYQQFTVEEIRNGTARAITETHA